MHIFEEFLCSYEHILCRRFIKIFFCFDLWWEILFLKVTFGVRKKFSEMWTMRLSFDLVDVVTNRLKPTPSSAFLSWRMRANGRSQKPLAPLQQKSKQKHVKDWQHRWHVMDTARLYPGLLSYIKWSVNTTFLLANGICQHERDVIVGLSFVSAEFAAKSRPPPLQWMFSVSSGKFGRIVRHNEITSAQTNKVKLSRRGALEPDCANYLPGSSAHPQRHWRNERRARNPSCRLISF